MWPASCGLVEGVNKISEGWLEFSTVRAKPRGSFSKGVVQAGVKMPGCTTGGPIALTRLLAAQVMPRSQVITAASDSTQLHRQLTSSKRRAQVITAE